MSTISIEGYEIGEILHENERARVYRAFASGSMRPLVLKVLRAAYPDPEQLKRLRHEFEITRNLGPDERSRAVAIEPCENGYALVLEDAGGEPLSKVLSQQLPGIVPFLRLAIRIADSLGRIHSQDVIHRGIKPAHIHVNRETGTVQIIDFSASTLIARVDRTGAPILADNEESATDLESPESLPYVSPEQTGRMNRAVDQRSDFYSLGVTFYEMLTGRPPFDSQNMDALELIHCHIAVQPEPPTLPESADSAFREVPPPVQAIVMKLLSKNPEDRYQSAFGLKADLQKCLALWKESGTIENFEIGASDVSGKFLLPQRLYGRETEINDLRELFRRCGEGVTNFLLVKGVTGIGKSSLVHDVRRYIAEHRGIFISGNFAEFRREVPYTAFIQAFQEVVRQILTESEEAVDRWRRRLREILGPNGSVIADVIPDIELILGAQEEALQLPAAESQNRFHSVFRAFVRGFASADHPLVLFLDDLHWADAASLQLIKSLVTDPDTRHILLIGAYRDGDAVETRKITQLAVDLARLRREPKAILLSPLAIDAVREYVADALRSEPSTTDDLADLVHEKTGGNPFFLNEFLRTLYHDRLIDFDSGNGVWQWDLSEIRERNITDNVAELLSERILSLPRESRNVLLQAACIGHTFDLYNLSIMHQKNAEEVSRLLAAPLREGMIVAVGEEYPSGGVDAKRNGADSAEDLALLSARYRFMHDRVLQAAYALLDEDRKILGHLIVGRHLLRTIAPEERDEHLIDIVNHLNLGSALIQKTDRRQELAELNLSAARKAKRSAAYETAARYIEAAKALLSADPWNDSYDLTLALFREMVEIEFQAGRLAEGHQLAAEVLKQTRTLLDRVPIFEAQVRAYNGAGDLGRGLETALDVLELLGLKIPRRPGRRHSLMAMWHLRRMLDSRRMADLEKLPVMDDPASAATVRLLALVVTNVYLASPEHLPILVLEGLRLILKRGIAPYTPSLFISYALLMDSVRGPGLEGTEAARLAMRLNAGLNEREIRHRVMFANAALVQHWREPIRNSLRDLDLASRAALEGGDYVYHAYASFHTIAYSFLTGTNLDTLEADFLRVRPLVGSYKQQLMAHHLDCVGQVIANLRDDNQTRSPLDLDGARFAASIGTLIFEELGGRSGIFYVHSMRAYLAYLFRDIPTALTASREAERYLKYATGSFATARYCFLAGLIEAGAARIVKQRSIKRQHLMQARKQLNQLRARNQAAPDNLQHAVALLEAELASMNEGAPAELAEELYDRSMAQARGQHYHHDEALANELAGEYYARRGRHKIAGMYFRDAYNGYARWRAAAKTMHLVQAHPEVFAQSGTPAASVSGGAGASGRLRSAHADDLDLDTVLQATRVLSGEIELERLLDRLIGILLRSAGAERGLFLLPAKDDGQLYIEAEQEPARKITGTLMHLALHSPEGKAKLPVPVVEYVRRTGESVVLTDAVGDSEGRFARVEYIEERRVRSVLCTPIQMHGQVAGVLYLENNLSAGAFTPDRVELLEVLAAQAAVSLENALLYGRQKDLTDSFARFVPNEFLDVLHKPTIREIHKGDAVEREITVLFQDIRGFTSLSESLDPTATFRFLNELLGRIAPPISQCGGFIDKYIGDAIMALFAGSPDDGLRAAIAMLRELREFNRERHANGETPVQIGLGLHTGSSLFGTVGVEDRLSTTVIGDTVNEAARLESATKKYGIPVLVSGALVERLNDRDSFHLREVDAVRLKGKQNASILFELFDHEKTEQIMRKRRALPTYYAALKQYRGRDFEGSLKAFEDLLVSVPDDSIARMYVQRCRYWLEHPPGEDWTHLRALTEK